MDSTLDFESQSALMKAAAKVHAQKLQARTVDGKTVENTVQMMIDNYEN